MGLVTRWCRGAGRLLAMDVVCRVCLLKKHMDRIDFSASAEVLRSTRDVLEALHPHLHDPCLGILKIPFYGANVVDEIARTSRLTASTGLLRETKQLAIARSGLAICTIRESAPVTNSAVRNFLG
jgi:hypothetical protein